MTVRTVGGLACRAGIGLIAGLTALGSNAAIAQSVALAPGMVVGLPGTDLTHEPDLAGLSNTINLRFIIHDAAGAMLCTGYVQQMIVRSSTTHFFHFYYRILKTSGPGAITRFKPSGFGIVPLSVAYRHDLPLGIRPHLAFRSILGDEISYQFDPAINCAAHQWTVWLLNKPNDADQVYYSAPTHIIATTGDLTYVKTYKPTH